MSTAATPPADRWSPLAERQLEMLSELAEIGLDVARRLGRLAKEAPAEDEPLCERQAVALGHVALAIGRVSRAVRVTLMLQSQLIETLRKGAADAESKAEQSRAAAVEARKEAVEEVVERLARDEHPNREWEATRIANEAADHLDEEADEALMDLPFAELVERICRDLGLKPDPARLAELSAGADRRLAAAAHHNRSPADAEPRSGRINIRWLGDSQPKRYYGPPWPKSGQGGDDAIDF
jgi:hypothetical protein